MFVSSRGCEGRVKGCKKCEGCRNAGIGRVSANADEDNSSVIPALPGMVAKLTDLTQQLMGEDNNTMTMVNMDDIEDNAMAMEELEQLDDNVDDNGP